MTIRPHRVAAFCDWLCSIPPKPPFHTRPEFRFYSDLTDAETNAAQGEMRRRSHAATIEAEALIVARSVEPRDLTIEQEAIIQALADAAIEQNKDVMDSADMLVGAALLILMRSYPPKVAVDLVNHLMLVGQESLREQLQ